jgi:hypothetical protein
MASSHPLHEVGDRVQACVNGEPYGGPGTVTYRSRGRWPHYHIDWDDINTNPSYCWYHTTRNGTWRIIAA